ncbi:DNA-binding transcriptional regulator, LysR family [Tistlia consotensis]|uniref:DNA-binding transcriptional regulator, LysR family n=1 Tax=Tistlia consotensis USBA 355 TaxID=560819 RepID=A0A1Y6BGS5_9PROT|nr:LysR family transcriptional regulator [Tistlia consotensis]SMF06966.1 DNA-binding transcriptional regulator, LysR family [Tistlia consotensis USBA 355]SNR36178.1 DNA-binding transcriptional regulator, LysR family [Tistlia consotensis]
MNRVTVAQLEAFFWIASLGSVERAAQRLHLSQPTISLRLRALEETVGLPLFDRVGRGLRLSLDGQALLPNAKRVLENIDQMVSHSGESRVRGRIRIGFAEGFALVCLAQTLERLHELYPDIRPEVVVATSSAIEPELHDHRLDLAFLVDPTEREGFTLLPLGAQETSWVAAPRWALPELVRPRDLAHLPIISNAPSTIGYRQVQAWFASAGLVPARLDLCSGVALLAHLVSAGTAIGILSSKMMEREAALGRVRLLRTAPALEDVPVFATFHADNHSPIVKALIGTVRSVLAEMDYLRLQ